MAPRAAVRADAEGLGGVLQWEAVRNHRAHDVGVPGQHGGGLFHLAHAVVLAVAQRRNQPGLAVEQRHPVQLHRPEVDAQDHDGAARRHQLGAAGQALRGAGSLDDDVVAPLRADARAEALTRLALVGVPRLERHVLAALRPGAGHGEQAQRACSDHDNPASRPGFCQAQRMP